jgi:hypothetical protein
MKTTSVFASLMRHVAYEPSAREGESVHHPTEPQEARGEAVPTFGLTKCTREKTLPDVGAWAGGRPESAASRLISIAGRGFLYTSGSTCIEKCRFLYTSLS